MTKKNAIVGQSGGPTAAINASLAGVISAACKAEEIGTVYGMCYGIQGMMEEQIVELNTLGNDQEQLKLLCKTPASYLGSCRYKVPADDAVYEQIFAVLEKYNIGYFFYIGGNDSMDTVQKLSAYAKEHEKGVCFVGVPKTIDNDLPDTDHTPGFGSAAKYIAATLREISADSYVYRVPSVTIVEIMGRNAGWLTASAALARYQGLGPDLIYLPERDFSFEAFKEDVAALLKQKNNVIVAISEGAHTADGKYVCEQVASGAVDVFGHKYLGGTARVLEDFVRTEFGCKARGIELNVPQRCAGHFLSKTDITESFMVGEAAVSFGSAGNTGIMTAFERTSDTPYACSCVAVSIENVANLEKTVPLSWINERGNDVTEEFIRYVSPLIAGEVPVTCENGLPKMLVLQK